MDVLNSQDGKSLSLDRWLQETILHESGYAWKARNAKHTASNYPIRIAVLNGYRSKPR